MASPRVRLVPALNLRISVRKGQEVTIRQRRVLAAWGPASPLAKVCVGHEATVLLVARSGLVVTGNHHGKRDRRLSPCTHLAAAIMGALLSGFWSRRQPKPVMVSAFGLEAEPDEDLHEFASSMAEDVDEDACELEMSTYTNGSIFQRGLQRMHLPENEVVVVAEEEGDEDGVW